MRCPKSWAQSQKLCVDCAKLFLGHHNRLRCWKCDEHAEEWKGFAKSKVKQAVKTGKLPAIHTQLCVSCCGPADGYHHVDYGRPLDVVPVCRSCNAKKGDGLVPLESVSCWRERKAEAELKIISELLA